MRWLRLVANSFFFALGVTSLHAAPASEVEMRVLWTPSARTALNTVPVRDFVGGPAYAPETSAPTDSLLPAILPSSSERQCLGIDTETASTPRQGTTPRVQVRVIAPGDRVIAVSSALRGDCVTFNTVSWPDGPYEIRLWTGTTASPHLTGHLLWYKGDPVPALQRLVRSAPGDTATIPYDLVHNMLAALVHDHLGDNLHAIPSNWVKGAYATLFEFAELQLARRGRGGPVHPYGMVRLAYRDDVDGSAQYCRAYLPPGYTVAKKWPVVIYLHGMQSANPPYIRSTGIDRHFDYTADRFRVIMLYPHGRGNSFYQGIGEQDVMRCLALARQRFSVDADQIYLMGHSMGGAGVWHIGSRFPELFAALAPIYGGREFRVTMESEEQAKLSPTERFRLECTKSSFVNAESLLSTPVFVNHGTADETVPIAISRYSVTMLTRWGYNVRYWEHPGKGHGGLGCEDAVLTWLMEHKRVAAPRVVRIHAGNLHTAVAHWVRVDQRDNQTGYVQVIAQVVDEKHIRLETENVLQITLTPPSSQVNPAHSLWITWNGVMQTGKLSDGHITLRSVDYHPATLVKTSQREGPVADIFTTPFIIVQGTIAGDQAMREQCEEATQAAITQWKQTYHCRPRVYRDTELSAAAMAQYSLLLIGGSEENAITRRLAANIPLDVFPDRILIDGHEFAAHDGAVQMVYPHPLNPARYVVVRAGTSVKGMASLDKLIDLTDYCLADAAHPAWITAGYLSNAWRFDQRFLEEK